MCSATGKRIQDHGIHSDHEMNAMQSFRHSALPKRRGFRRPRSAKKPEWLAVAGPEDATLQVVGVLKRLARDCLLTTQSETREYLRRSTSRNQQFPDCRDAGVIRTVKVDYIYPPLRPSGSLQILTHGHGQITRATAGIRRKAAVAPQLSTSVPRNATDPF